MAAENFVTHAWHKHNLNRVPDVRVHDALLQWERGDLQYNFLDSVIPDLVPLGDGIHRDVLQIGVRTDSLMMVLSQRGTYTPFHQDPVVGQGGAGWMWQHVGVKEWEFVSTSTRTLFTSQRQKG